MWDNLLRILILNVGYVLVIIIFGYTAFLLKFNNLLVIISLILGLAAFYIYSGAVAMMTKEVSNNEQPGFADFIQYVKETWKFSLIFSLIFLVFLIIILISFPFYLSLKNMAGLVGGSLLFWISIVFLLIFQYCFPVYAQLEKNFKKLVKKCFLIFLDNLFFSICMALVSLLIVIVSVFLGFLLPGFSVAMLWMNAGLKIRLYKYDYLEENPDANRRKIPWAELYKKDNDTIGKRTLKNLIFPWRE
jgi:uncharacterized membrane protein YesL